MCKQIVHLKRFQFVNNQWTKSQQDVKFSCTFNPLAYRDSPEYNAHESCSNSQFSSKCVTPTEIISQHSSGSMCNLLIQNEGNSCSSTLSAEKDSINALKDEELLLNSAAETLVADNEKKEQQHDDAEQDSAQNREVQQTSPQPDSEIKLEMTDGTSSPIANGEMAAEITSAKAISVSTLKSPIHYNLFAIAVRYHMVSTHVI